MTSQSEKRQDADPPIVLYIASRIFDLFELVVRFGVLPLFFYLCVVELAGHETVVNVVINYMAKGNNIFPWALAGGTTVWAYSERRLRQIKTQRMSDHVKEIEKRLDPERTSSGLTPTGQTPRTYLRL